MSTTSTNDSSSTRARDAATSLPGSRAALGRVPIPWKVHWQRSRYQIVPIVMVVASVLLAVRLWQRQNLRVAGVGEVSAVEARVLSPSEGVLSPVEGKRLALYESVVAGQPVAALRKWPGNGPDAAVPVVAPISGKIVSVNRVVGQTVRAGDVVMVIAAERGQYVMTYVPPESGLRLEAGMAVDVRLRGSGRKRAVARVERVGPQIEPMPAHQVRAPRSKDWGLPAILALPPGFDARPGELVDLTFRPGDKVEEFVTSPTPGADLPSPSGGNGRSESKYPSH